jgi:hypothetical protein
MGARFIGADRDQVFLMPPSVRDWVPEGHLVWTVLDAVGQLDLSAFYAVYRADGHGRPVWRAQDLKRVAQHHDLELLERRGARAYEGGRGVNAVGGAWLGRVGYAIWSGARNGGWAGAG